MDDVPVTVTSPAPICVARALKDWYACLPGATSATVLVPYGVVSVTVAGTSPSLTAVTATYTDVPRQRDEAVTVSGVSAGGGAATTVKPVVATSEVLPALSVARYRTVCSPTWFTGTGAV